MKRRGLTVGLLVCVLGAGGWGDAAAARPASRRGRDAAGSASALWQAQALPGDRVLAGPVLVGHRALWVEAGRRLLVRSLDDRGRARIVFYTSATPGAPKGIVWPFGVESLAAGNGRVAFLEEINACASAPARTLQCAPSSEGPPVDSVTLFAGRPGQIRPVRTWIPAPPSARRCGTPEPVTVGVADAGLVVREISPFPCAKAHAQVVLRSFSGFPGRLVRVLARGSDIEGPYVAGGWMALLRLAQKVGQPDQLQVVRIATGQTALRFDRSFPSQAIDALAVDRSGRFAMLTGGGHQRPCQANGTFDQLNVGQIGHPGLQVLSQTPALGLPTQTAMTVAISGPRVAYGQSTGRCLTTNHIAVTTPSGQPIVVAGLTLGAPLAVDGTTVATAHSNTVQLAAIPR